MNALERNFFLTTLSLLAVGTVMIYSTTAIYAHERLGDSLYYFRRELFLIALGLAAMFVARAIGVERLRRYSLLGLVGTLVILISVLLFGHEAGGAKRWFRIFGFSFQPVEMAKLFMILYLADFLARHQSDLKSFWKGFVPANLVLISVVALILLQPDLGSSVLLMMIAGGLFYISGMRQRYLIGAAAAALPMIGVLILIAPYRMRRFLAFLNPWDDPQGVGFQSIQSFLAMASGGWWGVGLGQSRQKLFFLPQAHTDFTFAIIGEELGFLGALAILGLFALFFWFGVRLSLATKNLFANLFGMGIMLSIGLEAFIHMGVAAGLLPTKGLPLPFISYGGSALLFHLICVGLVLSLSRYRRVT